MAIPVTDAVIPFFDFENCVCFVVSLWAALGCLPVLCVGQKHLFHFPTSSLLDFLRATWHVV